jgi:hypothetical protein
VRFPVEHPADPQRPKAGLRCTSSACPTTLVMIEADFSGFGEGRNLAYLNCPFCGSRLGLVGYFEITRLVPADG